MRRDPSVVRIGTRGSDLARWQAQRVRALLEARGARCEIEVIRTSGDADVRPPAGMAVKGLFTKEIEEALLHERIDLAVHSLKDLLIDVPAGLALAAFPERADPRDALVTRDRVALAALPRGARVGTSSVRRAAAVRAVRPDLTIAELRGNVPTRVRRVEEGQVDAAVLALAGLTRLALADRAVPLDPDVIVPAAGQGALAVETRADDGATLELVRAIDDPDVRAAVAAERAALAELETGCNVPIGALCTRRNGVLTVRVAVYAIDGRVRLVAEAPVEGADPVAAGRNAAARLVAQGARDLIDEAGQAAARGGSRGA